MREVKSMTKSAVQTREKETGSVHARRFVAYLVLIILTVLCLVWFYILFINATRDKNDLRVNGFSAVPGTHLLENLNNLFHGTQPVLRGMVNSIIVAGCSAILSTYFSTMTAYAIHAYRFKGRKVIFTFILAIMMIPTQVSALGFVDLMTKMHLMNTYIPLILPSIAAPVVFFYMKQYMDSNLPGSLIEAARIDGAGEFRIFNRIVFPLMKPAVSVQAIFTFVSSWNNYFIPSLILKDENMKTLPVLIAELRSADFLKFDMGQVYAMIAFSIFPVIIVYLLLSKNIVGGVTAGGVKE
jgi:multiple sugar transport system permease protein